MIPTQVKTGRPAPTGDGEQADARDAAELSIEERAELWRKDRMRYRLRHQMRPYYAMGLLVVAAGAARAAAHLTGDQADVALATAGAAFVAAVVIGFATRSRLSTKRARRWATACALAAATWLAWVAQVGLSFDSVSLLAMLTYALATPYWARHRLANTTPPPPPAPAAEPKPGPDGYAWLWASYCGGSSTGPLPGSWVTGHQVIESGERFVLRLVPGKQTLGSALQALPLLRTGLHLTPREDLIVERHPLFDESCLQLTIVTKSKALAKTSIDWPGPNYAPATGTVALGPFVDGDGTARWRVYSSHRMWGGFLAGSTGSGKSRTFDSLGMSLAATDFTVVWFGDPQQGASSPMLARHADYVARDIPAIREMLALAMLIKELRQAENALEDREGFEPSEARPGLMIMIDECHGAFADPQIQFMATTLAREGGKVGIAIVGASQTVTQDTFGLADRAKDAEALRSNLLAGNLLLFYLESGTAKQVLRVDVDPSQFPKVPGYCYLIDRTGEGRSAPLRGFYVRDQQRDGWATRITWRGLDAGAANAAGARYLNRRDQAAADKAALAAKVAALRAGQPVPTETPAAATTGGAAVTVPVIPGNVIQFPSWPPSSEPSVERAAAAAVQAAATGILATERGRRIYDLIHAGVTRTGELEKLSGYKETHTRNTLRALVAAGLVRDAGHGKWEAADADEDADQEVEQPA